MMASPRIFLNLVLPSLLLISTFVDCWGSWNDTISSHHRRNHGLSSHFTTRGNHIDQRPRGYDQKVVTLGREHAKPPTRITNRPTKQGTSRSVFSLLRGIQVSNRSRIHPAPGVGNNGTALSKDVRWSPQARAILTAVERLEKLSKLLVQLSRKMSSRSAKNFKMFNVKLRKIVELFDQKQNSSQTKTNSSQEGHSSKGPGLKRSAHGSSFLCPSEFVGGGSWTSCYKLSALKSNWHEARSYCASIDADLLSMETLKEAYIIDYIIKSYGMSAQPDSRSPNKIQHRHASLDFNNLGYHQRHRADREQMQYWTSAVSGRDDVWKWSPITGPKPITYSRWPPHKPDSEFSRHCMVVNGKIGNTWDSVNCYEEHQFICEIDID